MTDEIEQLLKSLHLTRIAEILDAELAKAEKKDASYQDLLAVLLRAQWHHRQETALAYRIKRAGLPEQWTLESFPRDPPDPAGRWPFITSFACHTSSRPRQPRISAP